MPERGLQRPANLQLQELHGIYSIAPQMEEIFVRLRRAARGDWAVLIVGETGTGKELAARAIHLESPRRRAPFREVNCAALSPTLLESELFGHVRGAFTSAVRDHVGLFRATHRGTLFLDEVAEIPMEIQGKLLRVLQDKTFVPVGATMPVRVDVRVVSASNRALRSEVAAGRFRADLSYRLRVVPIYLPPLRDRRGDVEALFWHFVDEMNRTGFRRIEAVAREVLHRVRAYDWPGNVRELHNVVEHAFAIGEGPLLLPADLTPELRGERLPHGLDRLPAQAADPERERIALALHEAGGRIGKAAEALGTSRQTLWRKLFAHGFR